MVHRCWGAAGCAAGSRRGAEGVLITGLYGSGKSTVAAGIACLLEQAGTEELETQSRRPWRWLRPLHATDQHPCNARWRSTSAGQRATGRPGAPLRVVTPLTVAIAALVSGVLLAMSTTSTRTCEPVIVAHSPGSALSQPRTCQSS